MYKLINQQMESFDFKIRLYPDNRHKTFKSFKVMYDFYVKENEFWMNYNQGELLHIKNHFINILNYFKTIESNSSNIQLIQSNLRTLHSILKNENFPLVYSTSKHAKFLTNLHKKSVHSASKACDYLFNRNNMVSISNKEHFIGLQKAYKYEETKDDEYIISTSDKLNDLIQTFDDQHVDLIHKYNETKERLDEEYENYKNHVEIWVDKNEQDYLNFVSEKKNEVEKLEKLYREKLRLESPAQYWDELSNDYSTKGNKWRDATLLLSFVYIIVLSLILTRMPETVFTNDVFDFNNLKVTISFAFVASLGVFLVRLFVKLTLSNYHLATDAKERYQLTHVYLSLLSENAISDNERNLVLQSIFSRSETGLIKGDSTPAFPESVITGIVGNIKR